MLLFKARDHEPAKYMKNVAEWLLANSQSRSSYFSDVVVNDPCWNTMLELYVARAEARQVSISSACLASGSPPTTALRYIKLMEGRGLLDRQKSWTDGRIRYVCLSQETEWTMTHWLNAVAENRTKYLARRTFGDAKPSHPPRAIGVR